MNARLVVISVVPLLLLTAFLCIPPSTPRPLIELNQAFAAASHVGLPTLSHYTGKDGQHLAYRDYEARDPVRGSVTLIHGSSADSRSMHTLAQVLASAGFRVYSLDMRGHGASGERGHIDYLGQLDDDLHQFVSQVQPTQPALLAGFSAGGGMAFRAAAGSHTRDFKGYVLLAPYLGHAAASTRSGNDAWVSVSLPRMIALTLLNRLHITAFNGLTVLRFGLDTWGQQHLTPQYDFNLASNMRPDDDLETSISTLQAPMHILVGASDDQMNANVYTAMFANSPSSTPVTIVAQVDHARLILQTDAIQRIVQSAVQMIHTVSRKDKT